MEQPNVTPRRDETGQPYVIGPLGSRLRLADLPSPENVRWVPRRKAELVAAVEGGLLQLPKALATYGITFEEFESWRQSLKGHGVPGLRSTRTQIYSNRRGSDAPRDGVGEPMS